MTTDPNCIFCKIIAGDAPADILFQNEELVVFRDIKPESKHHFLVVPKKHILNVNSLQTNEDRLLVERMLEIGKKILAEHNGDLDDVRIGFHCPPFNSINHLHLHVISPASEMGFIKRQVFRPNTWWFQSVDDTLLRLSKL
ncbi:adenosine 5'-monophosphoramidase HINT3 [Diabrotica virgifera virgifera]|uniref:Adenosine 5'-monophosphoramidase HINT3 n=1 Tax=Diabrotica virgifera virgifera TaxID=50390 RepID=A0ABM5IKE7_DIAVI|nr:adenosine 5'-monophosphoramidase HINT3 [Diabrotica virgifera virgifera]